MARLFFALAPPLALREELALRTSAALASEALRRAFRTIGAGELHLTLLFVGEVPESGLRAMPALVPPAVVAPPAPRLAIRGTGAFPSARAARVLWWGLEDPERRLIAAHRGLRESLEGAGWMRAERSPGEAFHPHLTVARARAGARPPPCPATFAALDWEAEWVPEALALYRSRPERTAARYEELARWPWAAASGAGSAQGAQPPAG